MRSGLLGLFRIGPFARVFGAASPLRLWPGHASHLIMKELGLAYLPCVKTR